jgi:hypothetical protein
MFRLKAVDFEDAIMERLSFFIQIARRGDKDGHAI